MKNVKLIGFIIALCLLNVGCEDKESLTDIVVKQSSLTLKVGESTTLEVSPQPASLTDVVFTFASDNESVATVSTAGVVTAVAEGNANITISAGGLKKVIPVAVAANIIPLTNIIIETSPADVDTLTIGETLVLIATAVPENATDHTFTWSSSDNDVATVGSDGTVTAKTKGQVDITASNGAGTVKKSITLTVALPAYPMIWTFDDASDLAKAYNGNNLTIEGTITSIAGTSESDKAVTIPSGSYLTVNHGIAANGRDNGKVNRYSLLMDIKIPASGLWYALYKTNLTGGDAVSWINESNHLGWGGVGDYSLKTIPTNKWRRVVITVNDDKTSYYLDGEKINEGTESGDNIDALALDLAGVQLFYAADGYDSELAVAQVQLWDKTLTDEEVAALGKLGTDGEETSVVPDKKGSWTFEDATDLTKAAIGEALIFNGTVTAVDGPSEANKAVNVPIGSYINVEHGMAANGSEANGKVNEYTIMLDIKLGQMGDETGTGWYSILQTQLANDSHDGVVWIDVFAGYKIGWAGTGGYGNAVPQNDWFRLVLSVKDGEVNYYVNGALVYTGMETNGEHGAMSLDPMGFLLFTDRSAGFDGEFYVSEIAVWNEALNSAQATTLGAIPTN